MEKNPLLSTHWADITADKIIREKGDKDLYTCASGITPSGSVHIGNFREIISVDLVVKALRDKGKNVRFIYSWDDYDVFRKVPKNMPKQELLESYLRKSIDIVPDVLGDEKSFARANEVRVESVLPKVGVSPEYIYQANCYRNSNYAEGMRKALEGEQTIRNILNEHRASDLAAEWKPVSFFCSACEKDDTTLTDWDKEWNVSYSCDCGHKETVDLRKADNAKLFWRIDWPMRWKEEGVDFEPAGKEHHSAGGSFDTAKEIVSQVYGGEAPVTFKYDFIRLKGGTGKLSSSSGEAVTVDTALEIYQPEIVRFMFAGTRPNAEFAISFDLDVLKIYEDYDKCERNYFNKPENEKKLKKWYKDARAYQLSQVDEIPSELPYQIQVRHLCNLLQIFDGDFEAVVESLGDVQESQKARLLVRCQCAWNWVKKYAPEDFQFAINKGDETLPEMSDSERKSLKDVSALILDKMDNLDEKSFGNLVYDIMKENGVESSDFFPLVYKVLIGKEKGPRLISFLYTIGKDRSATLLGRA